MPVRKSTRIENKIMATSTPNTVLEQSPKYSEKSFSPILTRQRKGIGKPNSSDEYDSSDGDYSDEFSGSEITSTLKNDRLTPKMDFINPNDYKLFPQTPVVNLGKVYILIGTFIIASLAALGAFNSFSGDVCINSSTLKEVQKKFPTQSEDVWDAISSGINEVKVFKKPSVFLLLYNYEASTTIDLFLHAVSRYASGVLNEDYNTEAIVLTSNNLNTVKARSDYGYIINKYKPELEKRSVMIVKNLDKIPGEIAQAFHSMCDEFTPLVGKTLFIFTIQVKNITSEKSDFEIVEDILKRSWRDLDDDIFYPLYTRISSIILRIEPERSL